MQRCLRNRIDRALSRTLQQLVSHLPWVICASIPLCPTRSYAKGPFDQAYGPGEGELPDADGSFGDHPPVSSRADDAASSGRPAGTPIGTYNYGPSNGTDEASASRGASSATAHGPFTADAPAAGGPGPRTASPPGLPVDTTDAVQPEHQHQEQLPKSQAPSGAGPTPGGVSGAGAGLGRNLNLLGAATTTAAGSALSFFGSATSVLQKVATHVAGAEEAADVARHRPQVELLKAQLLEVAEENEALGAEVARLRRALQDAEDSAEMLQVAELGRAGRGRRERGASEEEAQRAEGRFCTSMPGRQGVLARPLSALHTRRPSPRQRRCCVRS